MNDFYNTQHSPSFPQTSFEVIAPEPERKRSVVVWLIPCALGALLLSAFVASVAMVIAPAHLAFCTDVFLELFADEEGARALFYLVVAVASGTGALYTRWRRWMQSRLGTDISGMVHIGPDKLTLTEDVGDFLFLYSDIISVRTEDEGTAIDLANGHTLNLKTKTPHHFTSSLQAFLQSHIGQTSPASLSK